MRHRRGFRIVGGYVVLDILLFLPLVILLFAQRSPLLRWLIPLAMICFFLAARRVLRGTGLGDMSNVGLRRHRGWFQHFLLGASLSLLYLIGLYVMRWLLAGFQVTGTRPLKQNLVPQLVVGCVWLVAAVQEELLMRGFVLTHLLHRFSRPTAIVLSAIVFVLHHYNHWIGGPGLWVAQVFLHGVLYALATIRSSSLWVAIGFHWAWNTGGSLTEGFLTIPSLITSELAVPALSTWLELGGDALLLVTMLWPLAQSKKYLIIPQGGT